MSLEIWAGIKSEVDHFDDCLGDAPGGHHRSLQWWQTIHDLTGHGPNETLLPIDLDRAEILAVMRYAIHVQNSELVSACATAGIERERKWIRD